jgi:catechol 2,3-dioxygenase-like lactoylglutathione lyase family enzyme
VIHHVQLAAPPASEERQRAFWVGVLRFEEVEKPPALAGRGGCWFRGHGIEVHVSAEEAFRPARRAHPAFLVGELDGWADRLATAGYPVNWDADFPGMRRFYSEDPFSNRLEFLEPPS